MATQALLTKQQSRNNPIIAYSGDHYHYIENNLLLVGTPVASQAFTTSYQEQINF